MAILTLDGLVARASNRLHIFFVTFGAGLSALIFDGEVFPFLDIAEAVEAVGEVLTMHAEVIRNQKYPGDEDHPYQSDGYP